MIKRVKAHLKRWWDEHERGEGTAWLVAGIASAVIVGGIVLLSGIALFLPALFLMWSAGFVHQVWEQVPALSYMDSLTGMIGLWVVGWTVGFLLRIFIFALFGGAK